MKLTNLFLVPIELANNVPIKVKKLGKFSRIIQIGGNSYYVKNTVTPYDIYKKKRKNLKKVLIQNVQKEDLPYLLKFNARFGGSGSFVVDMQGIHSFLYARSKVFSDKVTRGVLVKLGLLQSNVTYLRIGASGSPKSDFHPGGEVLEYSLIQGNGGGVSQTHSGYLPEGSVFSRGISLKDARGAFLREERALYSHTAFLPVNKETQSEALYLDLHAQEEGVSALEVVDIYLKELNIQVYSIQLFVSPRNDEIVEDSIIGRVLKHLPKSAIKDLTQAAQIASEQSFALYPGQYALFFGTNYKRVYKDWEAFREGRPYEPFGHIHGGIVTDREQDNQHNVFHLRKLFLSPKIECKIIITPIRRIVTIEPVRLKNGTITSKLNHSEITLDNE